MNPRTIPDAYDGEGEEEMYVHLLYHNSISVLLSSDVCSGLRNQLSILEFARSTANKNHVPLKWTREESDLTIENFILLTDQAFSVVDNASFRRMLMVQRGADAKEKDYPHRTKLMQNINQCAEKYVEELKSTLKDTPGRISFTFDGWTSSTLIPIIGITAHYIDNDWTLRTNVISFAELQGSHSGDNIGQCLYDVVKTKYGIEDKLMNISSDNVTINDRAMRALSSLLREDGISFDAKDRRSQ